jgi:hypothetical protein
MMLVGILQVLEALLLALLKDTASSLYRQPISMFIREILVGGGDISNANRG